MVEDPMEAGPGSDPGPGLPLGSAQRALMESGAIDLYKVAIDERGLDPADRRLRDTAADRPAFDLLVELGLLTLDPARGRYVAVDPADVHTQVVAPLGQQATRLLEESSEWSRLFSTMGQSYRRAGDADHPVSQIRGPANINRFLTTLVDDAREELLTAQPMRGLIRPSRVVAAERDLRAVQRGVSMRTLYQHTARRSAAIQDYVREMRPFGAQVRTLEEFFNRMIVVDRAVVLVPGTEGNDVAIAIREPSVVAYLVDVFERYWERGRAFDDRGESTSRTIADETRTMTVRMLREGHSDPASAKRVGVSTRTYAGYVASLKDEYGVQTRFQLGYALGQFEPPAEASTTESAGD